MNIFRSRNNEVQVVVVPASKPSELTLLDPPPPDIAFFPGSHQRSGMAAFNVSGDFYRGIHKPPDAPMATPLQRNLGFLQGGRDCSEHFYSDSSHNCYHQIDLGSLARLQLVGMYGSLGSLLADELDL